MNTADRFRRALAEEEAGDWPLAALSFRIATACDCGCGLPTRLEIRGPFGSLSIADPIQIDAVVDMLAAGRTAAWGPRPEPGKGGES